MTKIKICGIKRVEDIEIINKYNPDYVGFVFAESQRKIDVKKAQKLKSLLNNDISSVGVFVNEDIEKIIEIFSNDIIEIAQLHGDEDNNYIKQLKNKSFNKTNKKLVIIKAINMNKDYDKINDYADVDYLLLDNGKGSGKTFNWRQIKDIDKPFFLAGGLNSENINEAISKISPFAIDLSSGSETNKIKDEKKIKKIMEAFRLSKGRYGIYGGQYISETLMSEIIHLEERYEFFKNDPDFNKELDELLKEYAGRPSLLYYAKRMSKELGGAKIYLKREDLNHTGSHKINNVLMQALLAKKMGKTRLIAETGAGQHGVATATAAALLEMECEVYMGEKDIERQALNVYKMKLLGAKVHEVCSGTKTLKDAVNETFIEWVGRFDDTHYIIGSTVGPHPFPMIVRDSQSVISREAREQILEKEGKLPKAIIACVGGGSNSMGSFYNFIDDEDVELIGCEGAGKGADSSLNAATMTNGEIGIFHGMKSMFCQNEDGQIADVYSISAGLDYPGIGPEHPYLRDLNRTKYVPVTDVEAVDAFEYLSKIEGIIPAIESSHAVAHAIKVAPTMDKDDIIIVCLSGRGDKDVSSIAKYRGVDIND
ncbi:tryptophan synthase subunit beta [Methanobrevibacter sp. DSM 116169]|uniref:tryptophan synthase subunit beta n=1 Tax=Methanobrevibacter sp. DSM 116169 TaxID=3242727 RepID=UPI0038FCEB43